jgi:hypothetical protein
LTAARVADKRIYGSHGHATQALPGEVQIRRPCPQCLQAGGQGLEPQCHVEERDRVFWAGAALSDAAGEVFNAE